MVYIHLSTKEWKNNFNLFGHILMFTGTCNHLNFKYTKNVPSHNPMNGVCVCVSKSQGLYIMYGERKLNEKFSAREFVSIQKKRFSFVFSFFSVGTIYLFVEENGKYTHFIDHR